MLKKIIMLFLAVLGVGHLMAQSDCCGLYELGKVAYDKKDYADALRKFQALKQGDCCHNLYDVDNYIARCQDKTSLLMICDALEETDLFIDTKAFRDNFEKEATLLAQKLNSLKDYQDLATAYNQVAAQYNSFMGLLKSDLSNYNRLKVISASAEQTAQTYAERYAAIKNTYKDKFLPVRQRINGGTKDIAIVAHSLEVFQHLISLIKQRDELSDEAVSTVLATVNKRFFKKLKLKTWGELGVAVPQQVAAVIPPKQANIIDPISIETPVFEQMQGFLEFEVVNAAQTQPMSLQVRKGKDLDIEELAETPAVKVNSNYLETLELFGLGTQYRLKVNNSAGVYIITLNSNNTVSSLYPYKKDKVPPCVSLNTPQAGLWKDIEIEDLAASPVVGRDAAGNTYLPAPNCNVTPPTPRYFTVKAPVQPREKFGIVLSKSELDINDLCRRVEAETGDLHERLAKVFGTNAIRIEEANLSLTGNKVSFDVKSNANVLPLTIYIRCQ